MQTLTSNQYYKGHQNMPFARDGNWTRCWQNRSFEASYITTHWSSKIIQWNYYRQCLFQRGSCSHLKHDTAGTATLRLCEHKYLIVKRQLLPATAHKLSLHIKSLRSFDAIFGQHFSNTGSGNGLLFDGSKPLLATMMTHDHSCLHAVLHINSFTYTSCTMYN